MRIAITGGTGLVGSHLARGLAAQGHEIVLVARGVDKRDAAILTERGMTFFPASVTDEEALAEAFEDCDAVAHCAGINREIGLQRFRSIHVGGTRAVVNAAKRSGVKSVVLLSYLRARSGTRSGYLQSKWEAEEIVRASGLDHLVVKAGVIFGKGDHLIDHTSRIIGTFHVLPKVGMRDRRARPVAVQDIVQVITAAIVEGRMRNETISVPGPEAMPFGELARRTAHTMGRRALIPPAPIWFLYIVATVAELTMKIPLVSRAQVRLLDEGSYPLEEAVEPPPDLLPTLVLDERTIRPALPNPARFRLEDFRWPWRRN